MSVSLLNTVLRAGRGLPLNVGERLVLLVAAWRADESGRTFMAGLAILQQAGLSTQAGYPALKRLLGFGLLRETRPVTLDVSRLSQMALAATLEGDASDEGIGKELASKEVVSKELANKELANSMASNLPSTSKELATINYKTNKTHTNACACEGSSVSGECAPTGDGQAESRVQVVQARASSSLTVRVEAAEVMDKESLGLFLKEYPKRAMNRLVVCAEWAALEAEGFTGRQLLGAMREGALDKAWWEGNRPRYAPRAEDFLGKRVFEDYLRAAEARQNDSKTQAQREAEEAARAKAAAEATDWLADEEI